MSAGTVFAVRPVLRARYRLAARSSFSPGARAGPRLYPSFLLWARAPEGACVPGQTPDTGLRDVSRPERAARRRAKGGDKPPMTRSPVSRA